MKQTKPVELKKLIDEARKTRHRTMHILAAAYPKAK